MVLKYYPNSSWSLKCETRGRAWIDINQSKTSLLIVYIGTHIRGDTKATHIYVKCSPTVSKSNDDYQETDVGLFSCCNILPNWKDRRSGLNRQKQVGLCNKLHNVTCTLIGMVTLQVLHVQGVI